MAAAGDVILFTFLLHAWIWSGGFGDMRDEDGFAHVGFLRAGCAVGGEKP